MIDIWTGFGRFKATNHWLTDQVRTVTKTGWFSYFEGLEVHQQLYRQTHQQTPCIVNETINTGKPETPYQTLHGNGLCYTNIQTQTLAQKEKTNTDTVRRITSEMKTTLPYLRNQHWRTVKSKNEKVNDLLTNIPTNDITDKTIWYTQEEN